MLPIRQELPLDLIPPGVTNNVNSCVNSDQLLVAPLERCVERDLKLYPDSEGEGATINQGYLPGTRVVGMPLVPASPKGLAQSRCSLHIC